MTYASLTLKQSSFLPWSSYHIAMVVWIVSKCKTVCVYERELTHAHTCMDTRACMHVCTCLWGEISLLAAPKILIILSGGTVHIRTGWFTLSRPKEYTSTWYCLLKIVVSCYGNDQNLFNQSVYRQPHNTSAFQHKNLTI